MVSISVAIDAVVFLVGVAILVYSVEELIENITKAALLTGVSAFLFAVIFAGMDFENWAFGVAAIVSGLPGVAIGSAFGSALFLVGVSVALAGVLVPFEPAVPLDYLLLLVVSPLIALPVLLDGRLSRADGVLLLVVFAAILGYLYWQERRGRETFRDEEIFLVVEPIRNDHPSIAVGNIVGSLIFFMTGNLGLLAGIRPFALRSSVVTFYWPAVFVITLLTAIFLYRGRIKRPEGILFGLLYVAYWAISYLYIAGASAMFGT